MNKPDTNSANGSCNTLFTSQFFKTLTPTRLCIFSSSFVSVDPLTQEVKSWLTNIGFYVPQCCRLVWPQTNCVSTSVQLLHSLFLSAIDSSVLILSYPRIKTNGGPNEKYAGDMCTCSAHTHTQKCEHTMYTCYHRRKHMMHFWICI